MKKLIITMMMLVSLQGFANSPKAPGQDGGGGGVIKRNGMYLTFGSAGMKVKLNSVQGMQRVPGLELILSVMDAQTTIDDTYKGQLINALLFSDQRRYFTIDQSQLNSETYARLIAEYSKLWRGQIDPTNLDLAAITVEDDTYLLPPFFALNQTEQAAILFHESIWTIKRNISYEELVTAEVVMQNHIEKYGTQSVYNTDLLAVFGKIFNNKAIIVAAAFREDIKAGIFYKTTTEVKTVQVSKRKTEQRTVVNKEPLILYGMVDNFSMSYCDFAQDKNFSSDSHCSPEGKKRIQGVLALQLRDLVKKYPHFKSFQMLYALRTEIYDIYFYNSSIQLEEINVPHDRDCVHFRKDGGSFGVCFRSQE